MNITTPAKETRMNHSANVESSKPASITPAPANIKVAGSSPDGMGIRDLLKVKPIYKKDIKKLLKNWIKKNLNKYLMRQTKKTMKN